MPIFFGMVNTNVIGRVIGTQLVLRSKLGCTRLCCSGVQFPLYHAFSTYALRGVSSRPFPECK